MKIFVFAFLLLSGLANAQNNALNEQQAGSIGAQRAAISAERSRLEAGLLVEEVACYKKFAVNNCLAKVNIRRREAMAGFRQQEILLNDEERKLKGADQIRKTNEKSSPEKKQQSAERRTKALEDYQERLKREKEKQQVGTSIPSNENAARAANAERLLAHQKKNQVRADMQAEAAEKAKKFNERQKEAQARRIQHEADQLKRGKPAAKPLPVPE
jgi:hypothetical protein